MWKNFDGHARSREDTLARINALKWTDWKPQGITLHNTAAPTLKQWAEVGPAHDARIRNLESYYENELHWHAGPHFFVSRNWINWFSNPLLPGVHSRCWNATRFGIEMVGDYNAEEFNSGDGALVRDNAVFLIAALNNKFGFKAEDLTFHVECKRDNHDCPGKKVVKAEVIARVKAQMAELAGAAPPTPIGLHPPQSGLPPMQEQASSAPRVIVQFRGKMSTFGGPHDTGMRPTEGLALFDTATQMSEHGLGDFVGPPSSVLPGLGRRLNPDKFYVACRFDYAVTSHEFLRKCVVHVANVKTGIIRVARPVDWGPNVNTGRAADLSPGLAKELQLETGDICTVTIYEGGK